MYVDDWLIGTDSEEEATAMFDEAKRVMADAHFPLAKWTTSSGVTRDFIGQHSAHLLNSGYSSVLGFEWCFNDDAFYYDCISGAGFSVHTHWSMRHPSDVDGALLLQIAYNKGYPHVM